MSNFGVSLWPPPLATWLSQHVIAWSTIPVAEVATAPLPWWSIGVLFDSASEVRLHRPRYDHSSWNSASRAAAWVRVIRSYSKNLIFSEKKIAQVYQSVAKPTHRNQLSCCSLRRCSLAWSAALRALPDHIPGPSAKLIFFDLYSIAAFTGTQKTRLWTFS